MIVPALTFWVVPEMVRVAGLTPVFADVDPRTFNLDPAAFERAVTRPDRRSRADASLRAAVRDGPILSIARATRLAVVEDCAHAFGARYRGRQAGTFGDAAFFSFQTLKPLNTYGGGMAVARDPSVLARVRARAEAEPWPAEERVNNRLKLGAAQRIVQPSGSLHLDRFSRAARGDRCGRRAPTCICGRRSVRLPRCLTAIGSDTRMCRPRSGLRVSAASGCLDGRDARPCAA